MLFCVLYVFDHLLRNKMKVKMKSVFVLCFQWNTVTRETTFQDSRWCIKGNSITNKMAFLFFSLVVFTIYDTASTVYLSWPCCLNFLPSLCDDVC